MALGNLHTVAWSCTVGRQRRTHHAYLSLKKQASVSHPAPFAQVSIGFGFKNKTQFTHTELSLDRSWYRLSSAPNLFTARSYQPTALGAGAMLLVSMSSDGRSTIRNDFISETADSS